MKSLNSLKKRPNWYFAGARDSGPLPSHAGLCAMWSERLKRSSPWCDCIWQKPLICDKKDESLSLVMQEREIQSSVWTYVRGFIWVVNGWKGQTVPAERWGGRTHRDVAGPLRCLQSKQNFEAHTERRGRIEQTRVLHHLQWRQPEPWLRSLNGDKGGLDSLHKPQQICAL